MISVYVYEHVFSSFRLGHYVATFVTLFVSFHASIYVARITS